MSKARAIAFVLHEEDATGTGVITDDPRDPGGVTRWGIALARHPELTREQLEAMDRDAAGLWYEAHYWQAIQGDALPIWSHTVMLDTAVLEGSGTAIRLLQTALRVSVDGVLGAQTLRAANLAHGDIVLPAFTGRRIVALSRDSAWSYAAADWSERAARAMLDTYV